MIGKVVICVVLLALVVALSGCPVTLTAADKAWMEVTLDSADYYWTGNFTPYNLNPIASEVEARKQESAEQTGLIKQKIDDFNRHGLLGTHPLVFNPLVSKGQKSDLSGSFSGSTGGIFGGYASGSIEGKSRPIINCIFCWTIAAGKGESPSAFIGMLPCSDVVIRLQESGPPTIRFKYNIGQMKEMSSWEFENPGNLIDDNRVLYATVTVTREQLKQGYLGLR